MTLASRLILSMALALSAETAFGGFIWTTIDYPGNVTTQLHGVSGDKILGTWYDFPNNQSGHFLYEAGNFTDFNLAPPDAAGSTIPWKIDGDSTVGWYFDASLNTRAFRFDGSSYESILLPASESSQAFDLSGDVLVGATFAGGGGQIFRRDAVTISVFGFPGQTITSPEAVSGTQIVGSYGGGLASHGFLFDGTTWITVDVPGANATRLLGVSDFGAVGQYYIAGLSTASFLYADGNITPLNYPGSVSTEVWDMEGNVIVGSYFDGTAVHGFRAVVPEPISFGLLALSIVGAALIVRSPRHGGQNIRQHRADGQNDNDHCNE